MSIAVLVSEKNIKPLNYVINTIFLWILKNMNKNKLFWIGLIPFGIMGATMASADVGFSDWQYWTVLGCMIAVDIIATAKTKYK